MRFALILIATLLTSSLGRAAVIDADDRRDADAFYPNFATCKISATEAFRVRATARALDVDPQSVRVRRTNLSELGALVVMDWSAKTTTGGSLPFTVRTVGELDQPCVVE